MTAKIGQRINVIGISGSGKTTMAARIGEILGIPHMELDNLYWQPDWQHPDDDEFRDLLREKLSIDSWVIDGNYSRFRDVILPLADTIIWLDFPRWRVMRQIINRTFLRSLRREALWDAQNRESFKIMFSKDSVVLWAWTNYTKSKQGNIALFSDTRWSHLNRIRLKSPSEAKAFIRSLKDMKKSE